MSKASEIAERCSDAFSADRYGSWSEVAQVLLDCGFGEYQTEYIMRSKWTRWAADQHTAEYGYVPAQALLIFMLNSKNGCIPTTTDEIIEGLMASS